METYVLVATLKGHTGFVCVCVEDLNYKIDIKSFFISITTTQ
jgi:hypothetical protein